MGKLWCLLSHWMMLTLIISFGAVLEDFEVRDALEIVISRKMEY